MQGGRGERPTPLVALEERTELDRLIPASVASYQTESTLRERRGKTPSPTNGVTTTMHQPQHHFGKEADAAVAASSPSRQLFYRNRIPSRSSLQAESRDYSAARPTVPVATTVSSDSTDSSEGPFDNLGGGGLHPTPQPGLPNPKQLHADYSHRLHKNQVAQGHRDFVVGGAHGRYRDYGGTLIEVPEEVYAVRKAALTVLDPITYCWVSVHTSLRSHHVSFLCPWL